MSDNYPWKYLNEHRYFVRHAIVAHYMPEDIEAIFEIGPGQSDYSLFTTKEYHPIEILEGNSLEDFDTSILDTYKNVAVIWLGIDTYLNKINEVFSKDSIKFAVVESAKNRVEAEYDLIRVLFESKQCYTFDINLGDGYWSNRQMSVMFR